MSTEFLTQNSPFNKDNLGLNLLPFEIDVLLKTTLNKLPKGGGHHEYPPVTVPVDPPQLHVSFGSHRGRPGGAVDQRQLSKAAPLSDAGDPLAVDIDLYEHHTRKPRPLSKHKYTSWTPGGAQIKGVRMNTVGSELLISVSMRWAVAYIHLSLVNDVEVIALVTWGGKGQVIKEIPLQMFGITVPRGNSNKHHLVL